MEITQEKLDQLKAKIQIDKPLRELLQASLVVGKPLKGVRLRAPVGASPDDYQEYGFDIKLLKIKGRNYKNGTLDYTGAVFGVQLGHNTMDLAHKEVCANPSLGKLVGVKYCFYLKDKCLYTRGSVTGWFRTRTSWNQKIVCF
jgi:hypothetical protein